MTDVLRFQFWERVLVFGRMVKFSHTVFALPFALSAVVLAAKSYPLRPADLIWVLLAMFAARSAAMGFNRIADARFDAVNPRTASREIPSGKLTRAAAISLVAFFSGLFVFAAAMLGKICLYFSIPVLALLFSYSFAKRFTWLCHIWLGFAIGLAPLGAWIAVAKSFSPDILPLSLALLAYIAGFDVLYALQDQDFDREQGLFSMPAVFGVRKSLWIARFIHLVAYAAFLSLYFLFGMGNVYLMTVGIIGGLLIIEHALVSPEDLSRVHIAFFHVNSVISVVLFFGVLTDDLLFRLFGL